MTLPIILCIILFLLLCSAFFSASETALTAITKPQIHRMSNTDPKRGKFVHALSRNMSRVLGTILLGNNLVNILATSLATHLFIKLFDETGIGIATLCMTFLILIFSELMPKLYAIHYPERVSLHVAGLMQWCVNLFFPVTQVVRNLAEKLWELLDVSLHDKSRLSSQEELRGAIDIFTTQGGKDQKDMLHGILDLSFINTEEVMIHRKDVETINKNKPLEDILTQILQSPYTRLPVWEKDPENIVGIVHVKTFLKNMTESPQFSLNDIIQEPVFTPETTPLAGQLEIFRKNKQHMAIVVDEYGDVQGVVTLEDILEEVMGKMLDEHDTRGESIRGTHQNGYTIEGTTTLRDIKRKTGWKLSHKEATTLGGFLIYETRSIPKAGETYRFQNFLFRIVRCHRRQITLVHISQKFKNHAPK